MRLDVVILAFDRVPVTTVPKTGERTIEDSVSGFSHSIISDQLRNHRRWQSPETECIQTLIMHYKDWVGILRRQTVPPPVFPSKAKKFAIGGSRPPRALRMSCPRKPPIIAQTGLNSWLAPFTSDL